MPQNLQQITQRRAKEAKRCMKLQIKKASDHIGQNVTKSQTKAENQNCQNFETMNKKIAFEKLSGEILNYTEEFRNQGFFMLMFLFCKIIAV